MSDVYWLDLEKKAEIGICPYRCYFVAYSIKQKQQTQSRMASYPTDGLREDVFVSECSPSNDKTNRRKQMHWG